MRKQFITLLVVLSLALTSVVPALASQTAIGNITAMQSSPDVFGGILAGLPQGFGIVRADDLALELVEAPPFLLDVREQSEWDEGHIEGAVHIPLREIAQNLELLPADLDAPLVVYCKSGHRAAQAMFSLLLLGYTDVRSLAGGIVAWQNAGYEVTTREAEAEAGEGPAVDADVLAEVDAYLSGIPEGFYIVRAEDLALELVETPPFLLDVREQSEWDEDGYIEGAVHIPLRELFDNLDALPEAFDAPIVVYCKSGHRGALAMAALQYYGYENVRNLNGGILAWQAAGYELAGGAEAMAEVDIVGAVDAFLSALPQGFGTVSADDLALELIEDNAPFLLDVREQSEWDEDGYIEGAVHIPLRELAAHLDLLPAFDTPIVVYCKSGHRGAMAMEALALLGYSNVRNLNGGILAWQAAEYEVTMEPVEFMEGEMPEVNEALLVLIGEYLSNVPEGFYVARPDDVALELVEDDAPFLLDVREQSEWDEDGYIEGAVHLPLRELGHSLDMLPADLSTPIVVYCKSGHRGALAMMALQLLGYENVRSLAGGIVAWQNAGYEVVTD